MNIIRFSLKNVPSFKEKYTLCLGEFDGVHLGHQYLIKKAKECGLKTALLTFSISPKYFLSKTKEVSIFSFKKRNDIFESLGIDTLLIMESNDELFRLSKEEFIEKILKKINAIKLVMGYDFSFGKDALGKPEDLANLFDSLIIYDYLKIDEKKISTRSIKEMVINGDAKRASIHLGRPISYDGKVISGLHNGEKIGFKTANIEIPDNLVQPLKGVYSSFTYIDGKKYRSISNFGIHPTIDSLAKPILETHLIGFNEDIVGKNLEVELLELIRKEMKFSSTDDLKKQIQIDLSKIA